MTRRITNKVIRSVLVLFLLLAAIFYFDVNRISSISISTGMLDGKDIGNFTKKEDEHLLSSSASFRVTNASEYFSNETSESQPIANKHGAITLVVQLRGELCNQISALASAKITQILAQQVGIKIQLIGQHQNHKKWVRGRDDFIKCFPNLRNFKFDGGVHDSAFETARTRQEAWLSKQDQNLLKDARRPGIQLVKRLLKNPNSTMATTDSDYSVPYLMTTAFSRFEVLQPAYYEPIREFFRMDEEICCKLQPEPAESVLHVRNFLTELGQRAFAMGFIELSPYRLVNELFRDVGVQENETVAIVSRFPETMQPYVNEFKKKHIRVRLINNQSGVEDFCFLRGAEHKMVGHYSSTFAAWAAILGNSTSVRLYTVTRTPGRNDQVPARNITYGNRLFLFPTYHQNETYSLPKKGHHRNRR